MLERNMQDVKKTTEKKIVKIRLNLTQFNNR
jgi:hypothetical protein